MFGAVNYPDIMLPAYIEDGSMSLAYFLPAIVVFLFLFVNIVLAVVYTGYTEDRDKLLVQASAKRCVALTLAFSAIAPPERGGQHDKWIDRQVFDEFLVVIRRLERQYGVGKWVDQEGPIQNNAEISNEERDMLWRELEPVMHQGAEVIGPNQFLKLPQLLRTKHFRRGPGWALRGAQCDLRGVRREDCRLVVDAEAHDCHAVLDEVAAGNYQRLQEIAPQGFIAEGEKIMVIKVRGKMGGEKILTQKLSKFRTISAQKRRTNSVRTANPLASTQQVQGDDSLPSTSSTLVIEDDGNEMSDTIDEDAKFAIWVGNIPSAATTEQLTQIFTKYGTVTNATLRKNSEFANGSLSWAFVKFGDEDSVKKALHEGLDGKIVWSASAECAEHTLHVKQIDQQWLLRHNTGVGRAAWRDTMAPKQYKLDWTSGVPLVWRRQADIHHYQEYVRFAGIVQRVNPDGTLDVTCQFDKNQQGKVPWQREAWDAHGNVFHRFMRGGTIIGLRNFLLMPQVAIAINVMIALSLVASFYQYVNRAEIIASDSRDVWHFAGDFIFCFFFTCEMVLKVCSQFVPYVRFYYSLVWLKICLRLHLAHAWIIARVIVRRY